MIDFEDAELLAGLKRAIRLLPAKERACLQLSLSGCSNQEIGAWLGRTRAYVASKKGQGIDHLKRWVQWEYGEPIFVPRRVHYYAHAKAGMGDLDFIPKSKGVERKRKAERKKTVAAIRRREENREWERREKQRREGCAGIARYSTSSLPRTVILDGKGFVVCCEQKAVQIVKRLRFLGFNRIDTGKWKIGGTLVEFSLDSLGVFGSRTFNVKTTLHSIA